MASLDVVKQHNGRMEVKFHFSCVVTVSYFHKLTAQFHDQYLQ